MARLTLGVEEEYMLIDPKTLELSSETGVLLEEGQRIHGENMKAEFHSAVAEVVTGVCESVDDVRRDLVAMRGSMFELADKYDLAVAAAGTHPTTHWKDVRLTEGPRYSRILDNLQDLARANLIYGMHCHVGIDDFETRVQVMNAARYFLPHMLALSCSSPFWQGKATGHMSTRTHIFKRFPRTGVPDYFANQFEYERYVDLLVTTGCIDNAKMIYWDIRPHPFLPTIEFRCCDTPTRLDESLAIVALTQAVVHKLLRLYEANMGYRLYRRALINENVYRAARYGVEGRLIDFRKRREVPTRDALLELCDFLAEDFAALGTTKYIESIVHIAEHGNSASRQLRRFDETGDAREVTRQLIEETREGVA